MSVGTTNPPSAVGGARSAPRPPMMRMTAAAAGRIRHLLGQRGKDSAGIRIGVRNAGCSGLAYNLEYADDVGPFDEVIEDQGVTLLIDPKAVMFLIGSEMDFVQDKLRAGFTFNNPNVKGECGCGESFHV